MDEQRDFLDHGKAADEVVNNGVMEDHGTDALEDVTTSPTDDQGTTNVEEANRSFLEDRGATDDEKIGLMDNHGSSFDPDVKIGVIDDHGTAIDGGANKVKCNYCGKVVAGFNRLKHHLGAVGKDVAACTDVPDDIKAYMRDDLLEKRKEKLLKEVGELHHPHLPLKRSCLPKSMQSTSSDKGKKAIDPLTANGTNCQKDVPFKRERSPEAIEPGPCVSEYKQSRTSGKRCAADSVTDTLVNGGAHFLCITDDVKEDSKTEFMQESARHAAKCIGRFVFEAGFDSSLLKFQGFQKMIDALIHCGKGYQIPKDDDMKGWILQEELKEVNQHVEQIKLSWQQTGCSILVDGWTDRRGRNLLCFFVDCPKGTIFLKSVDATNALQDVDALFSLFCAIVEEVGIKHVVQVVTHATTFCMDAAGKKLMEKHKTLFWTISAEFCIDLMLEKIWMLDQVKKVLDDVKLITRHLYSHPHLLDLMRRHTHVRNLVRASRLKSVAQFLTLETLVSEKENLMNMVSSAAWKTSLLASRGKGKHVTDLIKDPIFWGAANEVVKATLPLILVLCPVDGSSKIPIGSIYDSMDRAKEAIKRDLGDDEAKYLPPWNIIDDIWDNYLHCPLHSAGYYLNPRFFYSSEFFVDAEVANGFLCCIVRLVESQTEQNKIVKQLDSYKAGSGEFSKEIVVDHIRKVPPDQWWMQYCHRSPQLQKFAIRILSQTCSGASTFKIRRSLTERLHTKGRNKTDQRQMLNAEFLHYNLRLTQRGTPVTDPKDILILEDVDLWEDGCTDGEES